MIDLGHLDALGGAKDPELQEIIDDFVAEFPQNLAEVRQCISAGERKPLRDIAHKLRGMAGSVGFKSASLIAAEVDCPEPQVNLEDWFTRFEKALVVSALEWADLKK